MAPCGAPVADFKAADSANHASGGFFARIAVTSLRMGADTNYVHTYRERG